MLFQLVFSTPKRRRNGSSERVGDLPRVIKVVSGESGFKPRGIDIVDSPLDYG
jgi:hypothetical protein